LKKTKS